MKTIEYYVREVYGNKLEYVVNETDAKVLMRLTGKKTINACIRVDVQMLSDGLIQFKRVLKP